MDENLLKKLLESLQESQTLAPRTEQRLTGATLDSAPPKNNLPTELQELLKSTKAKQQNDLDLLGQSPQMQQSEAFYYPARFTEDMWDQGYNLSGKKGEELYKDQPRVRFNELKNKLNK